MEDYIMLNLGDYSSRLGMDYREHIALNPFIENYDYNNDCSLEEAFRASYGFLRFDKNNFNNECAEYIKSFMPYVSSYEEFRIMDNIGYQMSYEKDGCTPCNHYVTLDEVDSIFGISRIWDWVNKNQIKNICCGSTRECLWGSTAEGHKGPIFYLNAKEVEGK